MSYVIGPVAPATEEQRLAALSSYTIFGTDPEPEFDRLAALTAHVFDAPVCLISLIGHDNVWFKARHGFEIATMPRSQSICRRVLDGDGAVVIPDATLDPELRDQPLVVREPGLRFYAGAALQDARGARLGTLCIVDTKPREGFSDRERALLEEMAAMVMKAIEKKRLPPLGDAVLRFATSSPRALITVDGEGGISYWNRAAERMFGYRIDEVLGRPLEFIIPQRFRDEHRAGMDRLRRSQAARKGGRIIEMSALRRDGSEFPVELTVTRWTGVSGAEFGAQIRDISATREREAIAEQFAGRDPLTGMMNRVLFRERLESHLLAGRSAALLTLELGGLKAINQNHGHAVGDCLLESVAMRLQTIFPEPAVIARMGGDEFAVLLGETDADAAREIAANLVHAFDIPFQVSGHTLPIRLFGGAAMAPNDARSVNELIAHAHLALAAAKEPGERKVRFYEDGMRRRQRSRRRMSDELRTATREGQWVLAYQPQYRLSDGTLMGVEALLRWQHPTRGLLMPGDFLQALEDHAVSFEVGGWIVHEACRQLHAWRESGLCVPRVGVNLFESQFASNLIETQIASALEEFALAPSDLEIEVTERVALRPDDRIIETLHALRGSGLHVALDDFGTGFASLTTLKQLPVTRLKIDKSFVGDIGETPHSTAIVAAMTSLARELDMEIIAEGIETEDQRARLIRLGCNAGQGFLLGRPCDPAILARNEQAASDLSRNAA